MDRQDRSNRAIKFLDDGGDCDDRDDHMETRLMSGERRSFIILFLFVFADNKYYPM